jgi:hypothetical protein
VFYNFAMDDKGTEYFELFVYLLRCAIFLLLMPVAVPLALLAYLTQEWWERLRLARSPLFFVLAPVYVPTLFLLNIGFKGWAQLVAFE